MIKYILFFLLTMTVSLSAQSEESDPFQEPPIAESMDEAISELSKLFEGTSIDSIMRQAFSFDGQNMQELDGALDSLGLSEIFGGEQLSDMFQNGMGNIDMTQLDQMMQQSLKMLEGMDMEQMNKMMEGIDMSEMMKMFEGMDMEGLQNLIPTPDSREEPSSKDTKRLKKI